MSKSENLCENIEIAVFSGETLSEDMKNHANRCERCRSFLEQNKQLENDLKALNLTGIKSGEIADKVMSEISKNSIPKKTKFNITHHFGTAAAMVIICAVALYVKNHPSVPSEQPVKMENHSEMSVYTDESQSNFVEGARLIAPTDTEEVLTEESAVYDVRVLSEEEAEEAYEESDEMSSGTYTGASYDMEKSISEGSYDEEPVYMPTSDQAHDQAPKLMMRSPSVDTDDSAEVIVTEESSDTFDQHQYTTQDAYESTDVSTSSGGGGGGSSGSARYSESEESENQYSPDYLVFGNLQFLQGNENFDYNIALANNRLSLLYGEGFITITRFCLENNGYGGNAFFFDYAPHLTYSSLLSAQHSSSPLGE